MEADWAVEAGPDLPSIDVPWEGFIDLCHDRGAVDAISEGVAHPVLREALLTLNSKQSRFFTTKCDVWKLKGPEIDPDEFNANADDSSEGVACYLDILHRDPARFASFRFHEDWVRSLTGRLLSTNRPNGRVDLVIRLASIGSSIGYGITVYVAGCGADYQAAYTAWEAVLRAVVDATMNLSPVFTGE